MDLALILSDRSKYGDEQEVQFGDGSKFTVGELRNQLLPKGDFTRASQGHSEEKRKLEASITSLTTQLAEAVATREQPRGGEPRARRLSLDEMKDDPVLGPLVDEISGLKEQYVTAIQGYRAERATERLAALGYVDPERRKAFLDFAVERGQRDLLGLAHDAFTVEERIKKAREESLAEGEKKGREAARLTIPTGGRRSPSNRPDDKEPGFLDMSAADRDPELLALVHGEQP